MKNKSNEWFRHLFALLDYLWSCSFYGHRSLNSALIESHDKGHYDGDDHWSALDEHDHISSTPNRQIWVTLCGPTSFQMGYI